MEKVVLPLCCIRLVGFLDIQHLSEKIGAFIVFSLFCLILPNLCRCVRKIRILYDESICSLICWGDYFHLLL